MSNKLPHSLSFGAKFKSLKSGYSIAAFFRTKQIVNLDKKTRLQSRDLESPVFIQGRKAP